MTNPVMTVREYVHNEKKVGLGLWVWCPGCNAPHCVRAKGIDGDLPEHGCWDWDGNMERPTIAPSLLVTGGELQGPCHSFIRDGCWEFLSDSAHALAGQTVPMVALPDWLVSDGG